MSKISYVATLFRAFFPSLLFNFRHLPWRQAIKLPILLYKPHILKQKGKITIDSDNVRFGMIKMGFPTSAIFPYHSGITIKNEGELAFKGRCYIGNDCYLVCGKQGRIEFGENFRVTAGLKMVSYCGISFGKETLIGWGCIIIDTNFHPLYDMEKKRFKKAFGKINIGDNNWFAAQVMVMPSVTTPEHCVFGAKTIVTRGGEYEPYCVHGGSPIKVLSRNVMRIIGQDCINDYSIE